MNFRQMTAGKETNQQTFFLYSVSSVKAKGPQEKQSDIKRLKYRLLFKSGQ